ncbi:hypothetical protein [Terasakiella pusilla]|uniref:hypothetical protein n=1 Tax=Terasakiella pusilla TaxID=64973 RepID=UPI0012EC96F9|nr:hypothetical protein [Terasakiella pusilla]
MHTQSPFLSAIHSHCRKCTCGFEKCSTPCHFIEHMLEILIMNTPDQHKDQIYRSITTR